MHYIIPDKHIDRHHGEPGDPGVDVSDVTADGDDDESGSADPEPVLHGDSSRHSEAKHKLFCSHLCGGHRRRTAGDIDIICDMFG